MIYSSSKGNICSSGELEKGETDFIFDGPSWLNLSGGRNAEGKQIME
jgi:hypothetical protein